MNCKKCGFPLTEENQTCPSCGEVSNVVVEQPAVEPVQEAVPTVEQTPVVPEVPVVEQPSVTSESIPTAEPAPIVESTPVTPVIEKKKNNTPLIIILIVLGLLLIGAGIFVAIKFLFPKGEFGDKPTTNTETTSKCGKVNLEYFNIKDSATGKALWGLTELGLKQETLVIPSGIHHFLGNDFGKNASYKTICFESDDDIDLRTAFDNSLELETITLPANLTHDFSMNNCPKLKEITIPEGIELIQNFAFKNDTSLKTVNFKGNKVKIIYTGAFEGCTALENITLPDSVETIYGTAFKDCTSLKSITLPKSLKYITNGAFSNSGLKTIIIPEELELDNWSKGEFRINIEGCTVKVYKDSWADIHFEEVFGSGMTKEYIFIK